LIIEDSENDAWLVVERLQRSGFEPVWKRVETVGRLRSALAEQSWDIAFSDHSMPGFSSQDALAVVQEQGRDIPFVILSGAISEEEAVAAMQAGAVDYVRKDNLTRLIPVVERELRVAQERCARVQAESAQRESQSRKSAMLDSALDCIVTIDHEGTVFEWNPAAEKTFGLRRAEVIGRELAELIIPPALRERHRQGMKRSLSTGQSSILGKRIEMTALRAGGTEFPVELSIARVVTPGPPIFTGFIRDITERKRAEEAARLKEEQTIRHQTALLGLASRERSDFEVALKDILKTDALTLCVERASFWSFRQTPKAICCEAIYLAGEDRWEKGLELGGADYPRYFHELASNPVIVADDAQADERTAEFADTYLHPLGITSMLDVPVWLRGSLAGVVCHEHVGLRRHWTNEEREFATSIGHMISLALAERERALANAALQRREEQFRSLVENSSDITTIVDTTGVIIYVSHNVERLLGYRPEELLNRRAFGWVHPDDVSSVASGLSRAMENRKEPTAVEFRFRHADGSWRVFDAVGKRAPNDSVTPRIIVNARDITERKRLEEQLRQFQKMESIGQLAAGVAHDFNNLLAVIQGHTDMLLGGMIEGDDVEESLKQVAAAAKRAAGLTRQLLAFSRKQEMQAQDIDLNEVVSGITKMLGRLLGADVALEFLPEADLPATCGDIAMMEQVLLNLSVNARDAMPGGGQLKIRTMARRIREAGVHRGHEARTGSFVCLSVTDTGCGIAPEILPRIFEPFFTTKEVGKGTGLGLATVYGIVKQHQGWIEVESEVGRGTTFNVVLPAGLRSMAPPVQPIASVAARGRGETILIAEDEPPLRRLAARILRNLGYEVLEAASGVEAIQVWEQHRKKVDLLLTDLVMPDDMTGRELAKQMQTREPGLKVIYTSGYAPETRETAFVFRGGINFLQKPYQAQILAKAIRDCLDKT